MGCSAANYSLAWCFTTLSVPTVGVDNMFILASALERQPRSRPLPQRAGLALAAVGPSILLAATCEVLSLARVAFVGHWLVSNAFKGQKASDQASVAHSWHVVLYARP